MTENKNKIGTIDTMTKIMESILMKLISLMQMEQEVVEMLFVIIQSGKVFHRGKNFLDEWLQILVLK